MHKILEQASTLISLYGLALLKDAFLYVFFIIFAVTFIRRRDARVFVKPALLVLAAYTVFNLVLYLFPPEGAAALNPAASIVGFVFNLAVLFFTTASGFYFANRTHSRCAPVYKKYAMKKKTDVRWKEIVIIPVLASIGLTMVLYLVFRVLSPEMKLRMRQAIRFVSLFSTGDRISVFQIFTLLAVVLFQEVFYRLGIQSLLKSVFKNKVVLSVIFSALIYAISLPVVGAVDVNVYLIMLPLAVVLSLVYETEGIEASLLTHFLTKLAVYLSFTHLFM